MRAREAVTRSFCNFDSAVDRRRPNQNTPAFVNVIANAETAGSSQDDALGWIRD